MTPPTAREYPTAVTGTWSDVERRAWYLYDNADAQSDARELAEAVLVLIGEDRRRMAILLSQ